MVWACYAWCGSRFEVRASQSTDLKNFPPSHRPPTFCTLHFALITLHFALRLSPDPRPPTSDLRPPTSDLRLTDLAAVLGPGVQHGFFGVDGEVADGESVVGQYAIQELGDGDEIFRAMVQADGQFRAS